jgi:FMN-dependent oxidoreductase (nitrilotriacetate monooxygenase family)
MHLATQMNGQGLESGSWRWPGENPQGFIDVRSFVDAASIAEEGKFDAFFLTDFPAATDMSKTGPMTSLDPVLTLGVVSQHTKTIGLVGTRATTFNAPYSIAREFRSLDLMSHGRAGWNLVTSGAPVVLLNYLDHVPSSPERHARSREVWEAVVRLWGSFPDDALLLDVESGQFADMKAITSIDYHGRYVSSRGPLALPPSPQGMPVVFTAGMSENSLRFAVDHADSYFNYAPTLGHARRYWSVLRKALMQKGRAPDSVTVFSGVVTSVASTTREALERREALDRLGDLDSLRLQLGTLLGGSLHDIDFDSPIPASTLSQFHQVPNDPRAEQARALARKGANIREIVAHGFLSLHPVAWGTPEQVADYLETWFRAGTGGGFMIEPDSGLSGLRDFVDQVVPILQKRGLFRTEYTSNTLRGHLGLPYRNGLT